MKKIFILLILCFCNTVFSQSLNQDKTALTNFIKRMYGATRLKNLETYREIALEYARNQHETLYNNINWK